MTDTKTLKRSSVVTISPPQQSSITHHYSRMSKTQLEEILKEAASMFNDDQDHISSVDDEMSAQIIDEKKCSFEEFDFFSSSTIEAKIDEDKHFSNVDSFTFRDDHERFLINTENTIYTLLLQTGIEHPQKSTDFNQLFDSYKRIPLPDLSLLVANQHHMLADMGLFNT
mmetsp:Transcript_34007/g.49397  ORF Transcript_34007/g.49397 Transcript_34007/m.49397 type:complete len:169 (+) Transcript_34007:39-545(+)